MRRCKESSEETGVDEKGDEKDESEPCEHEVAGCLAWSQECARDH